jgi:hypothetical protein
MKKVFLFTAKAMIVIILFNLSLQLISEANTFANIIGVFVLVEVAYLVINFIINKFNKYIKNYED